MCAKELNNDEEWNLDEILKDARNGSSKAKNDLFVLVQKYLAYIADQHYQSPLKAKAGVSDVVQQTMMRATSEFENFRGESGEQFRSWLRQILLNEVKLIQRHYGADKRDSSKEKPIDEPDNSSGIPVELFANSPTPSAVVMAAEDAEHVLKVLQLLPPQMRLIIQLRNWERLPFNEIAEQMGLSLSQAAKLWYQALEELKRLNSRP